MRLCCCDSVFGTHSTHVAEKGEKTAIEHLLLESRLERSPEFRKKERKGI